MVRFVSTDVTIFISLVYSGWFVMVNMMRSVISDQDHDKCTPEHMTQCTGEISIGLLHYFTFKVYYATLCKEKNRKTALDKIVRSCSDVSDPLTLITENNDLGWASSQTELDRMCPKLMDGLACINSFTIRSVHSSIRAYNIVFIKLKLTSYISLKYMMPTRIKIIIFLNYHHSYTN